PRTIASFLFSSHSNISVFACISPDTLSIVPSVKLVRSNLNSNWYSRSEVAHTLEQSSLRRSRGDTPWEDLVRATSGDQENIWSLRSILIDILSSRKFLNKYEACAVRPDQDRRLQTPVENACRDLVYSLLFERCTALDRNVDISDLDGLAFQMIE